MADELFKQQQKQEQIQATREAEQLQVSAPEQQMQQQQQMQESVREQVTSEAEQIMNSQRFSEKDGVDPADPPMEFTAEQEREWYDRKQSDSVKKLEAQAKNAGGNNP